MNIDEALIERIIREVVSQVVAEKAVPLINYIIVPSDYFLQIMQTVYNVKKEFIFIYRRCAERDD